MHLRVRAHVGRRNVVVRADVRTERMEEAARDALELGARDGARIELDAALAAAERKVHERALPRHHRGERFEIVEPCVLVVTHAALERAEDVRVLDAVALEQAILAVVHQDGEMDDDLVLRLTQDEPHVLGHLDDLRRFIEIVANDAKEIVAVGGRGLAHGADPSLARWEMGPEAGWVIASEYRGRPWERARAGRRCGPKCRRVPE